MTHVASHPPGAPVWVDLMTDDTGAARRFYAALFDWTYDVGPPESGPYITCLLGGRRVAGMGPKQPGNPMPTVWSIYLGVEDAEAKVAAIQEAGGTPLFPPMDVFDHGRMAVATDPTGATFGMWQPKSHTGFATVNEPGSFAWTDLYTRDLAGASAFYTRVFGYKTVNMDGMPYVTLHVGPGDKAVGGIMQVGDAQLPPGAPPHWSVYFAVADTDASVAKVKAEGGRVLAPAFDTEYGRIAVVGDPQGGSFAIIKLSAKALEG